jgi:hypothetical protein
VFPVQAHTNRRFGMFNAKGVEHPPCSGRRVSLRQVAAKVYRRRNRCDLFNAECSAPPIWVLPTNHPSHQLPSRSLQKRRQLGDQVTEGGKVDLLLPVAQGFSGVRMNFDQQAIRAYRRGATAEHFY